MIRIRQIGVWLCAIFLAVAFVFAGVSKLAGASALRWSERFDHWGYPAPTPYIVGIVEMLGGLAVLVPRWRDAAALALGAIMAVALCTHVAHGEFPRILPPLLLGGLAFLLSRLRY